MTINKTFNPENDYLEFKTDSEDTFHFQFLSPNTSRNDGPHLYYLGFSKGDKKVDVIYSSASGLTQFNGIKGDRSIFVDNKYSLLNAVIGMDRKYFGGLVLVLDAIEKSLFSRIIF